MKKIIVGLCLILVLLITGCGVDGQISEADLAIQTGVSGTLTAEVPINTVVVSIVVEESIEKIIVEPTEIIVESIKVPEWCNEDDVLSYLDISSSLIKLRNLITEKVTNDLNLGILPNSSTVSTAEQNLYQLKSLDVPPCLEKAHNYNIESTELWSNAIFYTSIGETEKAIPMLEQSTYFLKLCIKEYKLLTK